MCFIIAFHANGPAHQLDLANDLANAGEIIPALDHPQFLANAAVLPAGGVSQIIAALDHPGVNIGTLVIQNNWHVSLEGNIRIDQIIVTDNLNNISIGDGVTIGSFTVNLSQCNENVRNLINFLQLTSAMEIIDIGANQPQDQGNLEQEVLGQNPENNDEVL
jgi:hypothetical protein